MVKRWFLTVLLTVLASTACGAFQRQPAVQVSTEDGTINTSWHAKLATPASLAGAIQMSGSASMAPSPKGSTNVTLKLSNASPGGVHPWEVHLGQCGVGTDDGVFGPRDAYKPVKVESDGHADGTATVPLPTPETGSFFVLVHASASNYETIVACGNLAPPTQ